MASRSATLTMLSPSNGNPSDGGKRVPRCRGRVLMSHCIAASLAFLLHFAPRSQFLPSSSSGGVGVRMLQEQGASSRPSSSDRSSSSASQVEVKEGMESDEEIRRVLDFGFELPGSTTSGREAASGAGADRAQNAAQPGQRRRGRSPADKEHKRLKRLLRNRVSAQQARERKKVYLNDLEAKVKDLEARNSELEERMSTLQNENNMLRQILKNTTVSRRGPGSNVNVEGR